MKMPVLVTGGHGMLGNDVTSVFFQEFNVIPLGREDLDITDPSSCERIIGQIRPAYVINCAAFTNVDQCEREPDKAFLVNSEGAKNLAEACLKAGTVLVHISTDYVFDGGKKSPYMEEDERGPINVYGLSKLKGEEKIMASGVEYIIVRTAWLYGKAGPNFVKTILKILKGKGKAEVVDDQVGSPTYTLDLAHGVKNIVDSDFRGIVHITNDGCCSWYEFAKEAATLVGLGADRVFPIPSSSFRRPAKRPSFSVLDTTRFELTVGHRMRPWKTALKDFLLRDSPIF